MIIQGIKWIAPKTIEESGHVSSQIQETLKKMVDTIQLEKIKGQDLGNLHVELSKTMNETDKGIVSGIKAGLGH